MNEKREEKTHRESTQEGIQGRREDITKRNKERNMTKKSGTEGQRKEKVDRNTKKKV